MAKCVAIGEFSWQGVSVYDVKRLSEVDLKGMLVSAVRQRIKTEVANDEANWGI